MEYIKAKNQLIQLYCKFNNSNYHEIDYIFGEILKKPKTELLFCDVRVLQQKKAIKIAKIHLKTKKPLQKIFKKAYFFGNSFYVNQNVLTPRFDSEILVENALKFNFSNVLDLCAGSGCLGLSIWQNKPNINLTFADISSKALKVCKKNAKRLGARAKFVKSNMFENIKGKFDLIVCNPPYIETDVVKSLDEEVKNFDPILSLDGGKDGLKFYRILFENLNKYLAENGKCLIEIGYNQKDLLNLFNQKFDKTKLIKDYNGQDRVILIEK